MNPAKLVGMSLYGDRQNQKLDTYLQKTAVNQNSSKAGVEGSTAGNGQDIGLIKITETGRQISNWSN